MFQDKLDTLASIAKRRKGRLLDNAAYLQFMWKADVVESWIADKENHVRSEDFGRDLSSVQTLLTKQETFDAGKFAFHISYESINRSSLSRLSCLFVKVSMHSSKKASRTSQL